MRLSIVVPVYNVEEYLYKCIDSLLDQDIDSADYEIILVDDGSTDKSALLCDEIARKHSNIFVIHKKNGGLSSARNAGIERASGDYIQFVDSDDYLCPGVLGALLAQIKRDRLDVLRFNYRNVNTKGEVFEPNKVSKPFVDYSSGVCDGLLFLNERLGYACYAVQFILKTALVKAPMNHFKVGMYFEDVEWTPRILLQAKRVASTDLMVYNYLFRTGSITRNQSLEKKRKILADQYRLLDSMLVWTEVMPDAIWFRGMISQTVLGIISNISTSFFQEKKLFLKKLRREKVFPLSTFHATKSAKNKIRIANVSPLLLCYLLRMNSQS